MVAGHLQEKKGYYYAVLSYKNTQGRRQTKWIATGLPAKGNKKKAGAFLQEQRVRFEIPMEEVPVTKDELFADYLNRWLKIAKSTIAITTYASYCSLVKSTIEPWFRKRKIALKDLTPSDIQDFYTAQLARVKSNTVIHYHAVIHRALKYAVKIDLIPNNPADKVDRPRKNAFTACYYSEAEFAKLFKLIEGTAIEVPVKLAAFYGLRRSEVLGLKWDAINFEQNTITICHTVTSCMVDGKSTIIAADTTKTKSSRRTLPLVAPVREMLLTLKSHQEKNRMLCGKSYNKDYAGYICLNGLGERISPAGLSRAFSSTLEKNKLRHIRFHDLRHSCATLLLAHHIPLKQIQEWLGHSDFNTTANIYAHMDAASKEQSASIMEQALRM